MAVLDLGQEIVLGSPGAPSVAARRIGLEHLRPETQALIDQLAGEGGFSQVLFADSTGHEARMGDSAAMKPDQSEQQLLVVLHCQTAKSKPDHGESNVAHELLHAVLMYVERFPRPHMPDGSEEERWLGGMVNTVQDLWVNRELNQMGYARPPLAAVAEGLRDKVVKGELLEVPGRPGEADAAAQLARFSHPTQACHWKRVREMLCLPEVPPQVVKLVEAMEPVFKDGDPFDRDGHKQMIEDLARAAGWKKEIIWRHGRSDTP